MPSLFQSGHHLRWAMETGLEIGSWTKARCLVSNPSKWWTTIEKLVFIRMHKCRLFIASLKREGFWYGSTMVWLDLLHNCVYVFCLKTIATPWVNFPKSTPFCFGSNLTWKNHRNYVNGVGSDLFTRDLDGGPRIAAGYPCFMFIFYFRASIRKNKHLPWNPGSVLNLFNWNHVDIRVRLVGEDKQLAPVHMRCLS